VAAALGVGIAAALITSVITIPTVTKAK